MRDTPDRPVYSAGKIPARANLEHLKREAKQLLKTMRSKTPAARLSEAQLLVARSYGFPSWRKLKSHVDALHDFGQQLINAVHAGDLGTIGKVLDHHPELARAGTDLPRIERPSDTVAMRLIHLAIAESKIDVLRLLIERGADLNARNADGRLPLHDCFERNHDDFAKILLEAGAIPDACTAAAYGMHDQLEQNSGERSGECERSDDRKFTAELGGVWPSTKVGDNSFSVWRVADRPPYDDCAWGPAAMVNSTDVARVLLEHGANPNWRDEEGNTPIHRVIQSRLVLDPAKFIQLLLDGGADPSL
jgi:ankyrin repeat protein